MKRKTNQASYFDDQFGIYDIRPGYPRALYEIIAKYKILNSRSNILEIGAGSGIASRELYSTWSSKMTLIEPGCNFYKILLRAFAGNEDVTIENTTFENYQTPLVFDAIFSATAFHWLDTSVKYKRSSELLKDDGLLILYWNNYWIDDVSIYNDIQTIYAKYGMGQNTEKSLLEIQQDKIESRKREIDESGFFRVVEHSIFKNTFDYSLDNYIKLLRTFPDHSKLPENFFNEIIHAISLYGNKIQIRILTNLEIAEKIWKDRPINNI